MSNSPFQLTDKTRTDHTEPSKFHIDFFIEEDARSSTVLTNLDDLSDVDILQTGITTSKENILNSRRLKSLREKFTSELIYLLREEDFEYGKDTKADLLVRSKMEQNDLATKAWLNSVYVEYFSNTLILIGILRIIARLDYYVIFPEGQTMAIAALSHRDVEVKECGVRAFESWGSLNSLKILNGIRTDTLWLQEYIDKVIVDLRREHNVTLCQEDYQE